MDSPLLSRPGAVPGDDGPDSGVADHYGDPFAEQRAAETGAVVVDRSRRDVLVVPGADRLTWLHDLTSQHLTALAPGAVTRMMVLSPHGHVEHHAQIADDGATTWLHTEPDVGAALLTHLERMRFMSRVEPALVTTEWALLSVGGPSAPQVLGPWAVASGAVLEHDGVTAWGVDGPLAGQVDLRVPRSRLTEVVESLLAAGAVLAGTWAYEALRIAAADPRLGADSDHRTIPNELPWLSSALHLEKGCYRGQETVARVHNLGRPPRRLVLLHLDGTEVELPPHGTPIMADGRQVGLVGSSARHHELGPVALALVKRTTPDDAALQVGDIAAAIDGEVTPAEPEERRARPIDRLRPA